MKSGRVSLNGDGAERAEEEDDEEEEEMIMECIAMQFFLIFLQRRDVIKCDCVCEAIV